MSQPYPPQKLRRIRQRKGHRQTKGDAPILVSAMCTPVLLHKSAYFSLEKAQILMKHKKFFPTPLPKSSFEGMRRSFLRALHFRFQALDLPSVCTTTPFLI